MPVSQMSSIAVVADAHFHDLQADFSLGPTQASLAIRRFADTVKSNRVFNESSFALPYTLDDIARRGIRHVVLLGDYSDDGQAIIVGRLARLLSRYEEQFGMRFYAVPGNHDIFGSHGRHRSKRFVCNSGGYILSTSDPSQSDPDAQTTVVTQAMYCHGYPTGLNCLPHAGFSRRQDDIHWETPCGQGDPDQRVRMAGPCNGRDAHRFMDATYLVEPFEGLWMMMIDANVFVPLDPDEDGDVGRDFADSTDAGWTAMLEHKTFVLDWMKDIAARAARQGKHLLAFSHYPAVDPLRNTREEEHQLIGQTSLGRRIPDSRVADAFIDAGIKLHFSGHLHVNDTALHRNDKGFVANISVPSLVAYPAGYKTITLSAGSVAIETIEIGECALDPVVLGSYRTEIERTGIAAERLVNARNYGDFLYEHSGHLVSRRHLRRDWPADFAILAQNLTLADVAAIIVVTPNPEKPDLPILPDQAALAAFRSKLDTVEVSQMLKRAGLAVKTIETIALLSFMEDWYRLKMAGEMGLKDICAERQRAYTGIAALIDAVGNGRPSDLQTRFSLLFSMFRKYSGLPCGNFSICVTTGEIRP